MLSSEDVQAIEMARIELRETQAFPNVGRMGCLGMIAGVALFLTWPRLLTVMPTLSFFTPFVMLGAFVGAVGSPFLAVFGGRSSRSGSHAAVQSALRALADPDAHREEQLRAAVVLLTQDSTTRVSSSVRDIDLVAEVERHLNEIDEGEVDSVPEG